MERKKMVNEIYREINLLKFSNGYAIELVRNDSTNFCGQKNLRASFFNKFNDSYIVQELSDFYMIRKDKDADSSKSPYFVDILSGDNQEQNALGVCYNKLEELASEGGFPVELSNLDLEEKNCSFQDYHFNELHSYLQNPVFNWSLNRRVEE
jgi:hypothetical protein